MFLGILHNNKVSASTRRQEIGGILIVKQKLIRYLRISWIISRLYTGDGPIKYRDQGP